MGTFDSVYAPCPTCDKMVEFQSKAGECRMKRYHYTSAPPVIAADLNGRKKTCACGTELTLSMAGCVTRVRMEVNHLPQGFD